MITETPLPGLLGYLLPVGARKWHAFANDGRSLCGRYLLIGAERTSGKFETITEEATPTTPDDCRACARKVEKVWFALDGDNCEDAEDGVVRVNMVPVNESDDDAW